MKSINKWQTYPKRYG